MCESSALDIFHPRGIHFFFPSCHFWISRFRTTFTTGQFVCQICGVWKWGSSYTSRHRLKGKDGTCCLRSDDTHITLRKDTFTADTKREP